MTLAIHTTPYLETCDDKPFYRTEGTGVEPWDYEAAQRAIVYQLKWYMVEFEKKRMERKRLANGNKETLWKGSANNKPKKKGLKQGWKRILEQEAFLRALAYERPQAMNSRCVAYPLDLDSHDNTKVA